MKEYYSVDCLYKGTPDAAQKLYLQMCEEKIIAFAHYRQMPSPLRGKNIGFLDDLFVCFPLVPIFFE